MFACQSPVTFTVTFTAFGVTNVEHARKEARIGNSVLWFPIVIFSQGLTNLGGGWEAVGIARYGVGQRPDG